MRQEALPFSESCPKASPVRISVWEQYARQNRLCAGILISQPQRYGGPQSLMLQWARLVLIREPNGR